MLRQTASRIVAGAMTLGLLGCGGFTLAVGTDAMTEAVATTTNATDALVEGSSTVGGHWDDSLCVPVAGRPIILPPVRLTHRSIFRLTGPSAVTLSIHPSPPKDATAPQTLRVATAGASSSASLNDVNGQLAVAGINLDKFPDGVAGKPTSESVTLRLPAGEYATLVDHPYCGGYFAVSLDSVDPVDSATLPVSPPNDQPSTKPSSSSKAPKAIKLARKSLVLDKGKRFQLQATVLPSTARAKLIFKSTNSKVATVTKAGVIKARKTGRAKIVVRCADGQPKAKLKLKVTR